jgi:hypothetical protein
VDRTGSPTPPDSYSGRRVIGGSSMKPTSSQRPVALCVPGPSTNTGRFGFSAVLTLRPPIGRRLQPKIRKMAAPLIRTKLADLTRPFRHALFAGIGPQTVA